MTFYGMVKSTYKRLLPKHMRHGLYQIRPLRPLRDRIVRRLEQSAEHDEIYDADYYQEIVDPYMAKSAAVMAASIYDEFKPTSVADLGCGAGLFLLALRDLGVGDLRGYDYSTAAIEICQSRGLLIGRLDLEHDPAPVVRTDVVVSTEVAEHLPEYVADHFIDILASLANRVVLTAATPGTEVIGTDHVNEQPHKYWIKKLERRGYQFQEAMTERWRSEWRTAGVAPCYSENVMIFRRDDDRISP